MDQLLRWLGDTTTELPASSFGKVMVGALRLFASDLDRAAPFTPDPQVFVPFFGEEAGALPSLRAALERILSQWLISGELDAATNALRNYTGRAENDLTPLGPATAALFSARTAAARGDTDVAVPKALAAVDAFRDMGAPWWLARSIRVLNEVGASEPTLTEEAAAIEESLGVLAPADR
jgi:hypothetical protein